VLFFCPIFAVGLKEENPTLLPLRKASAEQAGLLCRELRKLSEEQARLLFRSEAT
jgi:hypothetical protein